MLVSLCVYHSWIIVSAYLSVCVLVLDPLCLEVCLVSVCTCANVDVSYLLHVCRWICLLWCMGVDVDVCLSIPSLCVGISICLSISLDVYRCVYTPRRMCVGVCICAYVYLCVCVSVCIFVHLSASVCICMGLSPQVVALWPRSTARVGLGEGETIPLRGLHSVQDKVGRHGHIRTYTSRHPSPYMNTDNHAAYTCMHTNT